MLWALSNPIEGPHNQWQGKMAQMLMISNILFLGLGLSKLCCSWQLHLTTEFSDSWLQSGLSFHGHVHVGHCCCEAQESHIFSGKQCVEDPTCVKCDVPTCPFFVPAQRSFWLLFGSGNSDESRVNKIRQIHDLMSVVGFECISSRSRRTDGGLSLLRSFCRCNGIPPCTNTLSLVCLDSHTMWRSSYPTAGCDQWDRTQTLETDKAQSDTTWDSYCRVDMQ